MRNNLGKVIQKQDEKQVLKVRSRNLNAETPEPLFVYVNNKKVLKLLLALPIIFLGFHVLLSIAIIQFEDTVPLLNYVNAILNLNAERNIPTFYSVVLLLVSAFLLGMIHYFFRNKADKHWIILSAIFAFLAFDEGFEVHEKMNTMLQRLLLAKASGLLHFPWVLPYIVFSIILAFYFFPFLLNLGNGVKKLFIISGILYGLGSVGLEIIEGYLKTYIGEYSFIHLLCIGVEEYLEMSAIALFIYALMKYISDTKPRFVFSIKG